MVVSIASGLHYDVFSLTNGDLWLVSSILTSYLSPIHCSVFYSLFYHVIENRGALAISFFYYYLNIVFARLS